MKLNNKISRAIIDLGVSVAIIALLVLPFYLTPNNNCVTLIIIKIMSILVAGWLILCLTHRWLKKTRVKLLAFVLLFVFGIIVYYEPQDICCSTTNILALTNNALSMFFPTRGITGDSGLETTFRYNLLHLLSYLYFAMIVLSIWGRRVVNRGKMLFYPVAKRNIFWNNSTGGMLLTKDILEKNILQQAIFTLPDTAKNDIEKDNALFEKVDSMGAVALYRNFEDTRNYPKGRRHFFLTEDEDFNLKMALNVAKSHNGRRKLHLYIRTKMELVGHFFNDYKNTEVYIFNQSDLMARKFVEDNPMLDLVPQGRIKDLRVNYDFKLLVLGFGWSGREVLNKTICDTQFVGSNFMATIIDRDMEDTNGEYFALFDECIQEYNLKFIKDNEVKKVGSRKFYEWLKLNMKNYDRIIVTLGDDKTNLEIAIAISRLFQQMGICCKDKIFAHVKEHDKYYNDKYPISFFGDLKTIYSVDVLINEKMDIIAKAVNYVYSNPQTYIIDDIESRMNAAEVLWASTNNIFNKDSSRAVAMNIKNIIKIANTEECFENVLSDITKLHILAENEHLRWNAFHFTKGVRRWADIPKGHKMDAKKFWDDDKKNRLLYHACLIHFEELQTVSDKVNQNRILNNGEADENFIETDYRIVRHFMIFKKLM